MNVLLAWGMMGWYKDAQFPKSHSLLSMSNQLSKIDIYLAENEQRMQRIFSTFQFKNKDLAYGMVYEEILIHWGSVGQHGLNDWSQCHAHPKFNCCRVSCALNTN